MKKKPSFTSLFRDVDPRLLKRWVRFHMQNPQVYSRFKLRALKMWSLGYARYSAWTILTSVRFEYDLNTHRKDEVFKINNDFVALYARQLLYDQPRMRNFFELRAMKRKRKALKGGRMKLRKIASWALILTFLSQGALAATPPKITPQTVEVVATGGAPIPDVFDRTNAKSKIYSAASGCNGLKVISNIAALCYLKTQDTDTASPASTLMGSHVWGPGSVSDYIDTLLLKKYWYIKCDGAPTSGHAVFECY